MLINILYSLLFNSNVHCITKNKSTYIIPSAQICIPGNITEYDTYLFGPCNTSVNCDNILKTCRFSKYRDKYCLINDAHFCAIQSKGDYINYYMVECG